MSSIGASVAAGVANAAVAAQQTARQKDTLRNQQARDADALRDRFEAHLTAIEADEAVTPVDDLHIDDQLPDHEPPAHSRDGADETDTDADAAAVNANADAGPDLARAKLVSTPVSPLPLKPTGGTSTTGPGTQPLYRHLDVTA